MKVRSASDRYIADARSLGGGEKKFPKTPEGRRAAQEHLRRVQAEHDQRGAYTNPTRTPTFVEAAEQYLQYEDARVRLGEMGAAHLQNKRVALADIGALKWGGKTLSSVRLGDLRAGGVKNELIPQLFSAQSYSTAQKKFVILKHMLQWAVESEILMQNPAQVKLPKRPAAAERPVDRISKTAIAAIIDHAAPQYRLAIKFAAYTGLRAGEQLALTWDDIDLEAGLVRVNKALKKGGAIGDPKTKTSNRVVELGPSLRADLRMWKLAQPVEQRSRDLVFPSPTGAIASIDNLRNRGLRKACKAAGVEVIRWHDLRHFFASVLLFDLEESEATVTALMGHHSMAFTLKQYGHWLPEARRDKKLATRLEAAFK